MFFRPHMKSKSITLHLNLVMPFVTAIMFYVHSVSLSSFYDTVLHVVKVIHLVDLRDVLVLTRATVQVYCLKRL